MNSVHVRYFRRMTACPTLAGLPGSKQRLEFAKCSTVSVLSIGRVSTDRLARTVQQMVSVYERGEFLANPPLWIHAQPDPVGLLFSPLWFFGVCQLKRKVPLSCLVLNPIDYHLPSLSDYYTSPGPWMKTSPRDIQLIPCCAKQSASH